MVQAPGAAAPKTNILRQGKAQARPKLQPRGPGGAGLQPGKVAKPGKAELKAQLKDDIRKAQGGDQDAIQRLEQMAKKNQELMDKLTKLLGGNNDVPGVGPTPPVDPNNPAPAPAPGPGGGGGAAPGGGGGCGPGGCGGGPGAAGGAGGAGAAGGQGDMLKQLIEMLAKLLGIDPAQLEQMMQQDPQQAMQAIGQALQGKMGGDQAGQLMPQLQQALQGGGGAQGIMQMLGGMLG